MLIEKHNLQYKGANNRLSLYDVIYPKTDAKLPVVVFCHGFKGFKDWGHFPELCKEIAAAGFLVVKFNFSHNGVGLTDLKDFTDLSAFAENNYLLELEDLDKLIAQLKKEEELTAISEFKKVSLIGHSRGGSVAILMASSDKRIDKVISWGAVADLEERLPSGDELAEWKRTGVWSILNTRTGQTMPMNYQFVEALISNKRKLDVERAAKNMGKPMLILHGENDTSIPLEHAYALQIWNPSAQLETIPFADHTFNGKHPFNQEELPKESKELVKFTLDFLLRN